MLVCSVGDRSPHCPNNEKVAGGRRLRIRTSLLTQLRRKKEGKPMFHSCVRSLLIGNFNWGDYCNCIHRMSSKFVPSGNGLSSVMVLHSNRDALYTRFVHSETEPQQTQTGKNERERRALVHNAPHTKAPHPRQEYSQTARPSRTERSVGPGFRFNRVGIPSIHKVRGLWFYLSCKVRRFTLGAFHSQTARPSPRSNRP